MSNKVKDIDIKNRTYNFFNDNMNIENFDRNKTKTDKKSHKNIFIYLYWICENQKFEYVKIYCVNPFYLIFRNLSGYFEEINKSKYLTLVPTNESKKIKKNMKNRGVKSEI